MKANSTTASGEAQNLAFQIAKPTASATTGAVTAPGRTVHSPPLEIDGTTFIVEGRLLKIARLSNEWDNEVDDPESIIRAMRSSSARPDLFTFWQRLPETEPRYSYYHEPEALSAIPLTTFKHWWEKQINTDTRKKAKRPQKRGVEIKLVELDDEFVRGVKEVFDEAPVRRGRPFRHYRKRFEELKELLSRDLLSSKFVGAYSEGKLVGLVKMVYAERRRFANPGLIVSKLAFRNKYVNNALMAKAVELCCADGVPYLTYTHWRRGTQAEFLARHGFQKIVVPRYWIPLTAKGALGLKLGSHHGVRGYIPQPVIGFLLDARKRFYDRRYKATAASPDSSSD